MKKIILITCVFGLNFNANASFFQTLQNNIKGILEINYKVNCDYKKDDQRSSITERANLNSNIAKNKEDSKSKVINNYINGDNNNVDIFINESMNINNYINGNNNSVSNFEDNKNNCEKNSLSDFVKEKYVY